MKAIEGKTVPEVWVRALRHLYEQPRHQDFDVFLSVASPTELTVADTKVIDRLDRLLASNNGANIHTVAETIFPHSDYVREGARGVYETYPTRMKEIHAARKDKRWGCYAMRMLSQTDLDGKAFVPLQRLVEKMRKTVKYTACYELVPGRPYLGDIGDAGDVFLYDPATDRKPYYGNMPCLSLASFKYDRFKNAARLNATYRSHYYIQRALGNMIGLGRLLYFVSRESQLAVGPMTINSTYAVLDTGSKNGKDKTWSMGDIKALLEQCESYYESS